MPPSIANRGGIPQDQQDRAALTGVCGEGPLVLTPKVLTGHRQRWRRNRIDVVWPQVHSILGIGAWGARHNCQTWFTVALAMLGLWWDSMILKVFYSLNDFMRLWSKEPRQGVCPRCAAEKQDPPNALETPLRPLCPPSSPAAALGSVSSAACCAIEMLSTMRDFEPVTLQLSPGRPKETRH